MTVGDYRNESDVDRVFQCDFAGETQMIMTKRMVGIAGIIAAITLGCSSLALADEVTTTTKTEKSAPGVTVGVPGVVGVEIGKGQDCTTRKKTVTDEESGTSVSKTQTKCE